MNRPYKTLYRSRNHRMIGGVAAGMGEYLGIDPTVVRLLFVLVAVVGWVAPAVVIYVVMMFVVPEEPLATFTTTRTAPSQPVSIQPEAASNAQVSEITSEEQSPEPPAQNG
jgi:phage shock protein C